jgi:hypothetical protein
LRPASLLSRFPPRAALLADAPLDRLGRLASLLVLAGGAWLLAGLAWDFGMPTGRPAIAHESSAADAAERLAGRSPFASPAPAAQSAVTPSSLMLVGVAASAERGRARAVIRREGQPAPLVAAVGDEIAPGLRLQRIERDQVVLTGPAGESRLALPQPPKLHQEVHD